MQPDIEAFFHEPTFTFSYVVSDPESGKCVIIDSVLDFDPKSARTSTEAADRITAFVTDKGLAAEWILETHVHADHLSGVSCLRERLDAPIGIGEHVTEVQATFKNVFNAEPGFATDGSQFDRLFRDGETFSVGNLNLSVMHTPGHTPACLTYLVADAAFIGDTLFMPDYGTARADFPGGDARVLYRSIQKLLALPPQTRLFMCHDYMPGGRPLAWESSVADERAENIHVHDGISEDEYVTIRNARDKTLDMPVLLLPSVQVNMRAGHLPPPEDNGISYLKLPLNAL
jgi:glyoxylase-like metal-dependent hydrolase (beta-lactamase superfamily II)